MGAVLLLLLLLWSVMRLVLLELRLRLDFFLRFRSSFCSSLSFPPYALLSMTRAVGVERRRGVTASGEAVAEAAEGGGEIARVTAGEGRIVGGVAGYEGGRERETLVLVFAGYRAPASGSGCQHAEVVAAGIK